MYDHEKLISHIKTFHESVKTKEEARAYLISTGIYNEDGSLHENYGGEKKNEKTVKLTETVFDLLAAGIHNNSDFHHTFVRRSIANSIYDQGPKIYSGLISVKAKNALLDGSLKRSNLCHEHPYPRTRTAINLIETFDSSFGKKANTEIKMEMSKVLEHGCKVHYVITKENQALYPFQQDYTLTEEEIYSKAGVELVEDIKLEVFPYIYKYNGIEYQNMSIPLLAKELNVTKYRIKKLIEQGIIERRANI